MSIAYLANDRAPMFRVSLILEALRARPVLMFAVAALLGLTEAAEIDDTAQLSL